MRRALPWLALLAAGAAGAQAGDAQAGRSKALPCVVCHGAFGVSKMPNAPHLAGQPEIYVAEQLRNFRSGRRPHDIMGVIAKGLSDRDIEDLAAWFGSLRIEVREGQ